MNDAIREEKIRLAYRLMCASHALARRFSAWMARLVLGRSQRQIERMESARGIR